MNIGTPREVTILELASTIKSLLLSFGSTVALGLTGIGVRVEGSSK